MKKFKFIYASLVSIVLAAGFTSCSDSNDEPAAPAAKVVEGTYAGDMECSVMGNADTFNDVTFTVTATDDATVNVTLPAFGEAPMAMPSITVQGVKVAESNGIAVLDETQVSGRTEQGKNYTVTFSGNVTGKTLDIKFNLQYGAMPMPMICSSKATKQ